MSISFIFDVECIEGQHEPHICIQCIAVTEKVLPGRTSNSLKNNAQALQVQDKKKKKILHKGEGR